ncbi:energy transducer TonB, partial [Falsiroseomonas sp. HW251]|uniref:energy transducer TonB n=1 Tax=Falsiroseomonas sp. HW251 TaxID=3390998 RepID=UPI003D31BB05
QLPVTPVPPQLPPPPAAPAPPAQLAMLPPPPPPEERQASAPPPAEAPSTPPAPPRPPPRPAQPAQPAPRTIWSPPSRTAPPGEGVPMASGAGTAAGALVPPRTASGVRNPQPDYPLASRRRGEQGRVVLLVHVEPDGRVRDLAVVGSSGYPTLDAEAERAVRRWRFEPATIDGRATFSTTTVGISFRLE